MKYNRTIKWAFLGAILACSCSGDTEPPERIVIIGQQDGQTIVLRGDKTGRYTIERVNPEFTGEQLYSPELSEDMRDSVRRAADEILGVASPESHSSLSHYSLPAGKNANPTENRDITPGGSADPILCDTLNTIRAGLAYDVGVCDRNDQYGRLVR